MENYLLAWKVIAISFVVFYLSYTRNLHFNGYFSVIPCSKVDLEVLINV